MADLTVSSTIDTFMGAADAAAARAAIEAIGDGDTVDAATVTTLTTNKVLVAVAGTDGTATGPQTSAFVSGYTSSAVGDLVCLDSAGKWQKADANTASLYAGLLGIALEVKVADAALLVALPGSFVYATAFPALTIGSAVYASETAGAITHTAPTTTDAATRVLGWAVHADKIYFNPSANYTTHT